MADVLARVARASGNQVIFSTGTDEHGGKIEESATKLGLKTEDLAGKMSQQFRDLAKLLNISNDRFIRTTDSGHLQRVELIWKALLKDIYKGKYIGWYCTGCEAFVSEKVAKDNNGVCPHHNRPYEQIEEENYFFKLSQYAPAIKQAIETDAFRIIPQARKNEIMQVLNEGLEDISVSRPKSKIAWGIPVPNDPTQVIYVWFEALMNYITVLGYPEHEDFKNYWPANMQVIGKDILRFHAAIWPGMLLSLGLALPEKLYVHGFITVNDEKMSKSVGNVVTPSEIVKAYGVDALRYYFLRHIPSYSDGDFTWETLHKAYNNELANELGNGVQRTSAMISQYQNGIIGIIPNSGHDQTQIWDAIEKCRFDQALDGIWEQVRGLNQYIEETKPWEINKQGDKAHLQEVLAYQVSSLLNIANLLQPFMPETALKIRHIFEEGVIRKETGTLFPRVENPPTMSPPVR